MMRTAPLRWALSMLPAISVVILLVWPSAVRGQADRIECSPLRADVSVRASLEVNQSRCYELHLVRGDYALIIVREHEGDVAVAVTRPDEAEPYQRANRFWTDGFEQVAIVARTSGSHQISVEGVRGPEQRAEYSLEVERLIPAEGHDAFRRQLQADGRVAWIRENAIEMEGIDMEIDDFSDLASLRDILRGVRVVMVGEQSHGDGTSNVARSRLVRYLHEHLGFDVLAFEAGLFDMHRVWQAVLAGDVPEPLWGGSETAPLSRYISEHASTERPLEIMGVDPQFLPGINRSEAFSRELLNHFERTNLNAGPLLIPGFREVLGAFVDGRYYVELPTGEERELLLESLARVIDVMQRAPVPAARTHAEERLLWVRVLETTAAEAESLFRAMATGDLEIHSAHRDREMAKNIVWIARDFRPDSRTIVWAHGFHTMKNPHLIVSSNQMDFETAVTMGHVATRELGDSLYILGATSYEGSHARPCRPPIKIVRDQVPQAELEELFEAAELEYAIVNLRARQAETSGLRGPTFARPVDHVAELAPWGDIFDGLLFLRTMHPTTCDDDGR